MKTTGLLLLVALASGCALVRQPPSEAQARTLEARRPAAAREAQARAEAARLEKSGLTKLEADWLTRAQRRGGWPP